MVPPTSSSLAKERTAQLAPPQHGGRDLPTLAAVRTLFYDSVTRQFFYDSVTRQLGWSDVWK
jgi:hypothetical protein